MLAVALAVGLASWFTPYQREYDGMFVCAYNDRRLIGHRVRVVAGRYHQTCTIIGTGPCPFHPHNCGGRVIDVSPLVARDLHMLDAGVVPVRVYLVR
jgi:hypothetical protein